MLSSHAGVVESAYPVRETPNEVRAVALRHAVTCLSLAALLLPFANGRFNIAVAAWLAPLFLLRFVRSVGVGKGLFIAESRKKPAPLARKDGVGNL